MENIRSPIGEPLSNYKPSKIFYWATLLFFFAHTAFSQAVITLVMPVGARQLGMGETAIAVADDVYATFWNPAGLAFGPLADEWELALSNTQRDSMMYQFTALGSKKKKGFLSKSTIWSGTKDGLVRFNGKVWKSYHEVVLEQEDNIRRIVRDYIGTEEGLDSLINYVKEYNSIQSKEEENELISLKLPYNLLFKNQEITAILVDKSHRVWVGTPIGLYRFDGEHWRNFITNPVFAGDTEEKEKTRTITCLALKGAEIWIGTENGLFRYRKTKFIQRGKGLLPNQHITALATHPNSKEVFIAMKRTGVARYTPARGKGLSAKWKLFNVKEGLLDSSVNNLVLDAYSHLWVGHPEGISHFSLVDWQRITFNKQKVRSLDISEDGSVWIGTNKGVWKHTPSYTHAKGRKKNKKKVTENNNSDKKGDWFHYHTGNALANNSDLVIETQGDDVWFVTEAGVERYNSAKSQVGIFYESLLPALDIDDLFHAYMGLTFPFQEWGTVGGFVNFISFGEIPISTENDETNEKYSSSEAVAALSYGTKLNKDLGLGLNVKFIYSALAPGLSASGTESDGVATSYALDLGLLYKNLYLKGLNLGFVMQNIGPAVFYVDKDQSDPIPFTWKLGLSYEISSSNHKILLAADVNREAVYYEEGRSGGGATPVYIGAWKSLGYPHNDDDSHTNAEVWAENFRKIVYNMGAEYTYANVVSFRGGYLLDQSGEREELDIGLGFMLSDILQVDATFIKDFGGGIRDGQKRFGLIFKF